MGVSRKGHRTKVRVGEGRSLEGNQFCQNACGRRWCWIRNVLTKLGTWSETKLCMGCGLADYLSDHGGQVVVGTVSAQPIAPNQFQSVHY